jgi:hypothetical protein
VLDDALNSLDAADRDAIVLRYLGSADLRSIGRALGASEDAAQKRLARALEKLRAKLLRRGFTFSGAVLATTLEAGAAAPPAPAGLVAMVTRAALAPAAGSVILSMLKSKVFLGLAAVLAVVVTLALNSSQTVPVTAPTAPHSAVVAPVATAPVAPPRGTDTTRAPDNAAILNALAQLAASQGTPPADNHMVTLSKPTQITSRPLPSGVVQFSEVQMIADSPLRAALDSYAHSGNVGLAAPADLLQQQSHIFFRTWGGLTNSELAPLMREAMEKTGVVFDVQPDGGLQARLAPVNLPRSVEVFVVNFDFTRGAIYTPPSPQLAVDLLISLSTGRQTAGAGGGTKQNIFWGPPVVDRLDIPFGVWNHHVDNIKFLIKADSIAEARSQLIDALRQQAGIVAQITPDRTLQMRLENGDNDPVLPTHDFIAAPIKEVISYLNENTGQRFNFMSAMPRGRRGADGTMETDPIELFGRSLTLHLESAPASRIVAQVRAALEAQANLVGEEAEDPRAVNMRLTTSATAGLTYTVQFADSPASQVSSFLRNLTGKTISFPAPVALALNGRRGSASPPETTPPVTLNLTGVTREQAIRLLRDALEQQSGIVLDEQPDGNFIARQVTPATPADP